MYATSITVPHLGGLSKVLLSEANELTRSHCLQIICTKPSDYTFDQILWGENKIPIRYVARSKMPTFVGRFVTSIKMGRRIKAIARETGVNVVSIHDVYAAFASLFAGLRGISLLTLHSTYSKDRFVMQRRFVELPLRKRLIFKIEFVIDFMVEVLCYNLVRGLICVSELEREDVVRKTLARSKIFLIRNGVDTSKIVPSIQKRIQARSKLGIRDDVMVFLFAGRMVPKNGPFLIAQSIPYVTSKHPSSTFVFVGDGPEKKRCESYLKQMHVLDNVHFLGEMDTVEILPVADVFVSHVSSLVKGIGLTVLEAMASAVPVIVGEDQVTRKIFKCGEELVCVRKDSPFELAENMIALADDSRKRSFLSLMGRNRVLEGFSLINRIGIIEALYVSTARTKW